MRPLAVEIQAFGPYPDRVEVDFRPLAERGLFVVAGDTGTGKSTIFGAMCFALYGVMPGKDGRDVRDVRSHHAHDCTPTSVRFTFEVDGEVYVVHRTPEYERPAKRGRGTTTEKATATLVRVDGDRTEAVSTRLAEVTRHCEELVGLTAEQFARVVLLPQGEFAAFLLAGSKDREVLLGRLFGADVYDEIVEELRRRVQSAEACLGEIDSRRAHHLATARSQTARLVAALAPDEAAAEIERLDHGDLCELVDMLAPRLADLEEEVVCLRRRADEAALASATATTLADRYDQAQRWRLVLGGLLDATERIDAAAAAARRSASARPVLAAAQVHDEARRRVSAAECTRSHRLERVSEAFDALGLAVDPTSAAAAEKTLAAARTDHDRMVRVLDELDAARLAVGAVRERLAEATTEYRDVAAALATVTDRLVEIDAALPTLVEAARPADDLPAAVAELERVIRERHALDRLEADLASAVDAAAAASNAADHVFGRFVATQAPRLAADLVDGAPCAVCGSTEHPRPAVAAGGAATSYDDVVRAQEARAEAERVRNALAADVGAARARLGEGADRPLTDVVEALERCREAWTSARAAAVTLERTERERDTLAFEEDELRHRAAALDATLGAVRDELIRREAEFATSERAADGLDRREVTSRGRSLERLADDLVGLDELFVAVGREQGACEQAAVAAEEALTQSGFGSIDEARAELLDESDERASLAAATDHHTSLARAESALEALEHEGVPVERPDTGATARLAEELASRRHQREAARHAATTALDDARAALADHHRDSVASSELRAHHERTRHAWRVCAEGGALRMPLRRWVLATELDRVTAAANVHLDRMTGGRYSLHRREEVVDGRRAFGLDLEVLDAHTGRTRATSTLSGGEQFQASLSLALGLADVVSHGVAGSGKRFEALFVDEGFGSLDPAALADAVAALHHLHAAGRMVGAITHVEAMKQDLHVGIEVRRLPGGAGSTLVVHP